MNQNMKVYKTLLSRVHEIDKRYESAFRESGKNYNIFSILRVSSKEIMHSRIIANLLNPKALHSQDDVFLGLFLQVLDDELREDDNYNYTGESLYTSIITGKSVPSVKTEVDIGNINNDKTEGGRIDIVIHGNRDIFIENKIYAEDQQNQLLRYNNYKKDALLLYLTLNGKEPDNHDKLKKEKVKYFKISYRYTILKWLKLCLEKVEDKPFIKETLNQYIIILKRLNGLSRSNEMSAEIVNTIIQDEYNVRAAFNISENISFLKKHIIDEKLKDELIKLAKINNLNFKFKDKPSDYTEKYWGFNFFNNESDNLKLQFEFLGKDYTNLIYGFRIDIVNIQNNDKWEKLLTTCKHKKWKSNSKWAIFKKMDKYINWDNDTFSEIFSIKNEPKDYGLVSKISECLKELIELKEKFL